MTTTEHGETGNVALVTMNDGKMNAFSFDMLSAVHSALDGCTEAGAVVITGNEKCLSAGFDLSVMGKGPSKEAGEMLRQGCDLMLRIAEFPRPVLLGSLATRWRWVRSCCLPVTCAWGHGSRHR